MSPRLLDFNFANISLRVLLTCCFYLQPASKDHPWRSMPRHAMTPHYSGTTLEAQARYATGVKEILENWLNGKPQREEYLIVDKGKVVSPVYTKGDATKGHKQQ